ncbi:MAG: DUF2339 domain-containing protein, partial [Mariniphaga sp.]|nr:DUF2339 domain-containing protein [Mariniphaga sp.]
EVISPEKTEPIPEGSVTHDPHGKLQKENIEKADRKITPPKKETKITGQKSAYKESSEIEKFIGENLINKIGIAVLIIGVSIGAKYAIDNNMISPLMRIILGYLIGFGLIGFAVRLKKEYRNFSAVLFSGAMAITYFITYAAYSYYNFYPQLLAVTLMVLITICTVALALYYKRQVIAHFGLVGAYVIPFLLREPFDQAAVLFSYMVLINVGILFLSFKKQWKLLNYLAFAATWIIFISWFGSDNYVNGNLRLCLIFLSLFFITFHIIFLAFKLIVKEKLRSDDIVVILLNSAFFYFVGFVALDVTETGNNFLGLFTLINALIHSISGYLILRSNLKDKNLFRLTIGMVLVFITIAIPIQFKDEVVTVLWAIEAVIMFWFGRTKKDLFYERISYLIIFLTFLGTIAIWPLNYQISSGKLIEFFYTPFLNFTFLTAVFVLLSFGLIYVIGKKYPGNNSSQDGIFLLYKYLFPAILVFVSFFTIFIEISIYWQNAKFLSDFDINGYLKETERIIITHSDIARFKTLWLVIYTMLFCSILSFVNFKWIKNRQFDLFNIGLNVVAILVFLFPGLYYLNEIRDSYLNSLIPSGFIETAYYFGIRYISYGFFALLFYATYRYIVSGYLQVDLMQVFEIVVAFTIVWLCSSELVNWMDISGSAQSYKLGLSILWGISSLILIIYGILKKKKHLRITAISIFGITLMKLFFYDIAHLETISKTIVFVSLGSLLLIISFLYN